VLEISISDLQNFIPKSETILKENSKSERIIYLDSIEHKILGNNINFIILSLLSFIFLNLGISTLFN